ncbi:MAG: hypothetical protein JSU72_05675 [Deltaproteobacteria bacterium]|nr:MAG: hypothetical protein JSU72_05675 [Deltaproteobacteria bacterium]
MSRIGAEVVKFPTHSRFKEVFHQAFSISPPRRIAASPCYRVPESSCRRVYPPSRLSSLRRLRTGVTFCLVIIVVFSACGYHFAGSGGHTPDDINSVAVDILQNQTAEVGLEVVFTNALLNEFIRWKRVAVKPRSEADAVLAGRISSIRQVAVAHVAPKETLDTRVIVTLDLTLTRAESDDVLWQNQALSYFEDYRQALDPLVTQSNRREALREIAVFLAEKIHLDIFEGF